MKQYANACRSRDDNRSVFCLINTSAAKQRAGPVTERSSEPNRAIAQGCSTICKVFLVGRKSRLVLGNEDTASKINKVLGSGLCGGISTETFIPSPLC